MKLVSVAAIASAALLGSTAVNAQAPGYYSATAMAPVGKTSIITRETAWACSGATCVAKQAPERDAVLCALVARQVGKLSSFTVGGAAYDPAALDKCNAKAK
ncbi:hypothetical protein BH09PSE4_BH09PSE4_21040 [soil metagenome]